MSDTLCTRCNTRPPGIEGFMPFVGPIKTRILAEICGTCWDEWKDMQIKVINELGLNMGDAAGREKLYAFAHQFFRFDGGDGNFGIAGPQGGLAPGGPSAPGDTKAPTE